MNTEIIEKWRLDRRYYYCRLRQQLGRDDRRVFLAVPDDFGNLTEVEARLASGPAICGDITGELNMQAAIDTIRGAYTATTRAIYQSNRAFRGTTEVSVLLHRLQEVGISLRSAANLAVHIKSQCELEAEDHQP